MLILNRSKLYCNKNDVGNYIQQCFLYFMHHQMDLLSHEHRNSNGISIFELKYTYWKKQGKINWMAKNINIILKEYKYIYKVTGRRFVTRKVKP